MSDIPDALRSTVIKRAAGRCEYCRLAQAGQEAEFHIDHIQPRAAGGPTVADNLALACVSCSLRKGARQLAADPETGAKVSLFGPPTMRWEEHFRWEGVQVNGTTAIGRATVAALSMNRSLIIAIRKEEAAIGRHPPQLEH